jgi:thiosulfate/3-mercaptopyruvate sulfurtransferase
MNFKILKNVCFNVNKLNSSTLYKYSKKYFFLGRSPVIETNTLFKYITDEKTNMNNVKIIDCTLLNSLNIQNSEINNELPLTDFTEKIPNSIYINPMDLSENKSIPKITKESLSEVEVMNPYNMPSNEEFSRKMKNFEIKKSDNIICYDRNGIYTSARLWFIFKLFGMKNVYVLNGGFEKWKKDKFPVEKIKNKNFEKNNTKTQDSQSENTQSFQFKKDESKLMDTNKILYLNYDIGNKMTKDEILDTRSPERHQGKESDPYPVLRKGSISNSFNIHYKQILDENNFNCLKSEAKIKEVFSENQMELDSQGKYVVYSGLGISSCILILAFDVIGKYDLVKFYPGGWFEMGNVEMSGNLTVQKILDHERNSKQLETFDKMVKNMKPDEYKKYMKQREYDLKVLDVKEKNFEYLKKKNKSKSKEIDGDYSSPDEMF